jgi:hypothetical protein
MPSLIPLAETGNWQEIHAMLDRCEGNVSERDTVQSALTSHFMTSPPLPAIGGYDATTARAARPPPSRLHIY